MQLRKVQRIHVVKLSTISIYGLSSSIQQKIQRHVPQLIRNVHMKRLKRFAGSGTSARVHAQNSFFRTSKSPRLQESLPVLHRQGQFHTRTIPHQPAQHSVMPKEDYKNWSKQQLADEIRLLKREIRSRSDASLRSQATAGKTEASSPPKRRSKIDPSKYSTRHIALKLAYLGKNYSGFEYSTAASVPSIETKLWEALVTACLIFPEDENHVDFSCCDYSKCGRTDRGVSAFGQVIGLRVRSNRPLAQENLRKEDQQGEGVYTDAPAESSFSTAKKEVDTQQVEDSPQCQPQKPFDDLKDEIHYARVLNRILPKDIRILAWCPSPPPDFSARFSCRERQYRYFFTNPAFPPEPIELETDEARKMDVKPGWLDIAAMKAAAGYYEGEHDFRNVCKIDPTKQLTNYTRIIYESTIEEVEDMSSAVPYLKDQRYSSAGAMADGEVYPKVYCFKVRGSAFLYHQIRHMVSLLFLVGQGLEKPTIINDILDVQKNPRKPNYNMADDVPLVLWDCVFPGGGDGKGGLEWRYVGTEALTHKYGNAGLVNALWETWREKKMDEILANRLLGMVSEQGEVTEMKVDLRTTSAKVFEGGTAGRLAGTYKHILDRKLLETPEDINERYAKRLGFKGSEDMKAAGGFAARRELRTAKRAAAAAAAEGEREQS